MKLRKLLSQNNVWKLTVPLYVVFVLISIYHLAFAKRIIPGVKVGDPKLGGVTYSQAVMALQERESKSQKILKLKYEAKEYEIKGSDITLTYDHDSAISRAFEVGRTGNIFLDFLAQSLITSAGESAKLRFPRTVEDLITPECSTRYTYYEERQVINTLCRLCDNPSGYSDWEIVSYYEHGLLKKRTAFDACWFDSITDEKKYSDKTQFAFFRVEYDDTAQIFYNLLTVIVMICVFILLAYIIKKSKKKKKQA